MIKNSAAFVFGGIAVEGASSECQIAIVTPDSAAIPRLAWNVVGIKYAVCQCGIAVAGIKATAAA